MTTGTILYCFILVAIVFFIQWMIIGYCINKLHKRIDEAEEIREKRNYYQNSLFDSVDCVLDDIQDQLYDIGNILREQKNQ